MQMGHAIGPSTAVADVHRQRLRQKKDVVYGLLFLLRDSADVRVLNPIENPCLHVFDPDVYLLKNLSYQT